MTNHWIDIKNADSILIIGSNAAEHHPICFKWVLRAKEEKGATIIHVDPKFSRTSARSDHHIPLRSGTDIAFLGGMIKHILDNELYFKEYILEYTNASFLVGDAYGFEDGLFSGWDAAKKKYDKTSWAFQMDESGVPRKDRTLQNERCVFQLMRKHFERYTLAKVSDITGVSEENLLLVYNNYGATGKPDKAGTILYALGWTQHTVGVQNIRASAILQLLLGNIGIAGGGINALRGEPNVQGSTDHCLLWTNLPGYLSVPNADLATRQDYLNVYTPVSKDPQSANWYQNYPKYLTSLLKGWYGEHANESTDFGYTWIPKPDPGVDYSIMSLFDRMHTGKVNGGFIFGTNPAQSIPNSNKVRGALAKLDWLAMGEIFHTESSDFWHGPGMDPAKVKTEVFILPSAHRLEKEGSISNSGRWMLWHYAATPPRGQAKPMGQIMVDLINQVRNLYQNGGGVYPEPLVNLDWPVVYDPDQMAKKINGYFVKDATVDGVEYKAGQQVPAFAALKDDGATACTNWVCCGSYTDAEGNKAKRRDLTQTAMQKKIGLFPNFSFAWPMNRRILYNRASVDRNGRPWNPNQVLLEWDGAKWVGDVPDGGWPPLATGQGRYPFIMTKEGHAQLFGPGRVEGPFPEHYEPIETPVKSHPFSKQLNNPCAKIISSAELLAEPGDARYPIVLTTYSMTEHWCSGSETRNTAWLTEAEPQLYVEMSPQLAKEKGIENGDPVVVTSIRGRVEAIAMVTIRIKPFLVGGKTVHLIGMPFAFGWMKPGCGDSTNRLTPSVGDPNTTIPEYKASLVNIEKAAKLTELF